jgi:prolyl oligopeptidase
LRLGAAILVLALGAGAAAAQGLKYPQPRKGDVVDDYAGTRVADPYRWLEDTNSAETADWVQAENVVAFGYLAGIPEREALRQRLEKLWNFERFGVPSHEGGVYVYSHNTGLQNQSVLYVQETLAAQPRALIDPNTLSSDGTVALAGGVTSPDGRYYAYGTSVSGSDWTELHVRDIASGKDLPDRLQWVKFSGESWTKDGRGFVYARYPEPVAAEQLRAANENHQLWYHRAGTPQSEDVRVYARPDKPKWLVGGGITDDGRYLVIATREGSSGKNRIYVLDLKNAKKPDFGGQPVPLFDANDATYDVVGNDGPLFYVRTNKDAPRFRVVAVKLSTPAPESWKTVVPEGADALEALDLLGNRFVASYLHDAHSVVKLFTIAGRPAGEIPLPAMGTVTQLRGRRVDSQIFYGFTSFLYPPTVFRYDVKTGKNEVFRAPKVDFDPSAYETKEVFYPSKDGTRVPMFLTYRKGIKLDGQNPTLVYAYGGFNISVTPSFSVGNLVWLEHGGIYAQPSLRGGGEYGEAWHQAGMKEKKQNVFDDYIAAAEYLIKEGYTSTPKLAISGASNGGLLVGAAMTQRPDLYAVALPAVGVMDMLRYHKFTIGWAWATEYGSSDDPAAFRYLYAYSPLHNLKPGTCYPATMVTTADHDDRVVPGHSFKFAATLQADQACDRPTLIRVETKAGHGGGKRRGSRDGGLRRPGRRRRPGLLVVIGSGPGPDLRHLSASA